MAPLGRSAVFQSGSGKGRAWTHASARASACTSACVRAATYHPVGSELDPVHPKTPIHAWDTQVPVCLPPPSPSPLSRPLPGPARPRQVAWNPQFHMAAVCSFAAWAPVLLLAHDPRVADVALQQGPKTPLDLMGRDKRKNAVSHHCQHGLVTIAWRLRGGGGWVGNGSGVHSYDRAASVRTRGREGGRGTPWPTLQFDSPARPTLGLLTPANNGRAGTAWWPSSRSSCQSPVVSHALACYLPHAPAVVQRERAVAAAPAKHAQGALR